MSYCTANLQMLHFVYYSTNIRTEYFKHAAPPRFFSSKCCLFHNATFFGSCIIHILYTECAKIKKKSGAKGLIPPTECQALLSFGICISPNLLIALNAVDLFHSATGKSVPVSCGQMTPHLTFRHRASSI